jgi:hypothetical protein
MKNYLIFSLFILMGSNVFGARNWLLIGKSDLGDEFFKI